MKWEDILRLVGREPVFQSALLLAGGVSVAQVRLQLSRWVAMGRLVQLRRGVYVLGEAWRKVEPHPFLLANTLSAGSYVSLQSALAYHGLIPEHAPVTTSVGPGRPETLHTDLGAFTYHHLRVNLLFGYRAVEVAPRQAAFIACPEKALLDLAYLTTGGDQLPYLRSLRLQHTEQVDIGRLTELAAQDGKPKLQRVASALRHLFCEDEHA